MDHVILVFLLLGAQSCCRPVHDAALVVEVTTYLYGTAVLPCTFQFITGPKGSYVTWVKENALNKGGPIAHVFQDRQHRSELEDPVYRGRTEMIGDLYRGQLNLMLRNVTFSDEGIYYCKAVNVQDRGNTPVKLLVVRLNASDPRVTAVTVGDKRRLKCFTTGRFRDPQIEWTELQDGDMKDLSSYGHLTVTVLSDGQQLLESVLDYNVQIYVHYWCHVTEGRLKISVRAVISDGEDTIYIEDNRLL
ncbi:butyrophilin-like protein 2 [Bombina bombina]|uniref:butyrophilin-like protein 2 n=1 Tax=Bombina bombina TaxID=8345 RepID=UPI00235A82FA|nr:butyrophilin-like protein 2 [Bombina bombina]XP_053561718.1 butyrophilin-like protein 2 [Bombina bombina]